MIRKLRRKIILVNMLLVSLVLLAVLTVQLFSAFQRARDQVYRAQLDALEWSEQADVPSFFQEAHKGVRRPGGPAPMIPVFTVSVDADHNFLTLNRGTAGEVTEELAQVLVQEALAQPSGSGMLHGRSISYISRTGDGTVFAFADNSWVPTMLCGQASTALLVGIPALAVLFWISLLLSRLALRPAEAAWEQQRRFVADASHELKTPLTVILTNSGILLSHPQDTVSSQTKWIEYIREEAQRMRGLVEDLLFLAKNDAARETGNATVVTDFSQLCWSALLPFESVAFEAGVALEPEVVPGLKVLGRADQLRRLTAILLDNAIKYAGECGRVTLTLDRGEKNTARLTVRNTGNAIPQAQLPHVFDRFYRADESRARAFGGYGLGLAIAKSIVDAHRGEIAAASSMETVFTVRLPLIFSAP